MAGESPDDLEARRTAGLRAAADAVAAAFDRPVPPIVPRELPREAPARNAERMSETNAILSAANARMDRIEHSVEVLSGEVSKVAELVGKVSEKVDARFNASIEQAEARASALVAATRTDFSKFSTPISLVGTVVLFLIGGFASYVELGVGRDFDRVEKSISSLTEAMSKRADKVDQRFEKFVDDTVPRHELDFRLAREEATTSDLAKTVTLNLVPRTEFEKRIEVVREDINTLKADTLKRADIDGRFNDFTKRLDLISNRVEALQATSAGTGILQEQLREAQSQIKELRDHWLSAASK